MCGDEDNGQTSAWYVFSAMGFYPVTPGTGQYAMGSPLFKSVKLHLQNGNTFEIKAAKNSKENIYVNSVRKGKVVYAKNYITYDDIMNGSIFSLDMSSEPNINLGTDKTSKPYSMSQD